MATDRSTRAPDKALRRRDLARDVALGHVTGHDVTDIRFRIGPDEVIHIGELLVADSPTGTQAPFYLRVTDLAYGAEAADGHWMERTAGTLAAAPDVRIHDREHRLFTTATASPLGYLTENGFRRPKTLPALFSPVRRAVDGDFAFTAPRAGDLELGHLRSGDDPLPDRVGLDPRALAQHVGIFATTGMGKSNLLKVLAGSCLESGKVGLLVLDPHGEYADGGGGAHRDGTPHKGLLHHPRADRLVTFTSRPIQGFAGRVHDLAVAATEISVADFANVYPVTDAQREALWAAGNRWGRNWLMHLAATDVESLYLELEKKFHEGTLNVIKRRAEQVLDQDVIHGDGGLSTTDSILDHLASGRVVLVDTSGLFPREELLVSAVLARRLLERHRAAYRDPELFQPLPPTCVILEEAQRVLNNRGGAENVFASIAREGRKFKVGLGAVTQQPRLISDELLSQFNTLVILGLADPTDRDRVRQGARQDLSAVSKEIQMLEPGEAMLTTPGAPFALPVKAHLYEHRILEVDPAPTSAAVQVDEGFY